MWITNTHVHVPPNFSAFTTPYEVVEAAKAENVRVLGVSNFYDQHVYSLIADLTREAGILPEYGLEFITLVPDLEAKGIRINDPANPGRMYLTGKGIDPFRTPTPRAVAIAKTIRDGNDSRAEQMVDQVARHFASVGYDTGVDAAAIIEQVAERGEVPSQWVSLQERHIARAFQEALDALPHAQWIQIMGRAYGSGDGDPACGRMTGQQGPAAPKADKGDPVGVQAEIRSRLLKKGTPGFVPEVPLSFEDAYTYILDMGGIPCYPILADGCDPVCPFEESPSGLAEELLRRGIHAAELIPNRNHCEVVDQYVRALTKAGLIVMAGTEHNTQDKISLNPICTDGEPSDFARQAFFDATCVVVAHADRTKRGIDGYVDASGRLILDDQGVQSLVREGAQLMAGGNQSPR